MAGPRAVIGSALACQVSALVCLFLGFVTPYWIISWPRVYSGFKRLGLWEACFAGNVIPNDPSQRAYHGCWWILATEYWDIRSWLMPPWFIAVQVLVTGCLVVELIATALLVIYFLRCCKNNLEGCSLMTIAALLFVASILIAISVIVFATMSKADRTWMPRPELNYLSWSFGLVVLSAFFTVFATIAVVIHAQIVRSEMKEPPKNPSMLPIVPKA